MSSEEQSRRGFLKGVGLAASGLVGGTLLPEVAEAQAQGQTGSASTSKGARFRAALAAGQPLLLPVVESIMLARLCELEGFQGGFMGGSGMAARNALPNTSIQTIKEVVDYETQVMRIPTCRWWPTAKTAAAARLRCIAPFNNWSGAAPR